jgi:hypothetical protein
MTIKLEFSIQELQIISQALHEVPYKFAAPILQKIDQQAQPQLQPKEPE